MSNLIPPIFNTYSGIEFNLLEPNVDMILIEDIARALSMQCRWNGHCIKFLSIAEHSLHVSNNLPENLALHGLLHDAAEAYVGDCITPLKDNLPSFKDIEHGILFAVFQAFGVANRTWDRKEVSRVDAAMVPTEANAILPGADRYTWLAHFPKPLDIEIPCYEPMIAEQLFLDRFYELMQKKQEIEVFKEAS